MKLFNFYYAVVRIGFAQDSYTVQEGVVRGVSLFIASNGVNDVPIRVLVTLQPGTAIGEWYSMHNRPQYPLYIKTLK